MSKPPPYLRMPRGHPPTESHSSYPHYAAMQAGLGGLADKFQRGELSHQDAARMGMAIKQRFLEATVAGKRPKVRGREPLKEKLQTEGSEPEVSAPEKVYALVDARRGPGSGKRGFSMIGQPDGPATFFEHPDKIPGHMPHHGVGVVEVESTKVPHLFHQGGGVYTTEMQNIQPDAVTGFQMLRGIKEGHGFAPMRKSIVGLVEIGSIRAYNRHLSKMGRVLDTVLEKSIDELPKGRIVDDNPHQPKYDYSELLPEKYRDHKIRVFDTMMATRDKPTSTYAEFYDPVGNEKGHVRGMYYGYARGDPHLEPHSSLDDEYKGKGIGSALYEALYKHAKGVHGVTQVEGRWHTPEAHAVHQRLAKKHGFEIKYRESPRGSTVMPPYEYELKSFEEVGPHMDPVFILDSEVLAKKITLKPTEWKCTSCGDSLWHPTRAAPSPYAMVLSAVGAPVKCAKCALEHYNREVDKVIDRYGV